MPDYSPRLRRSGFARSPSASEGGPNKIAEEVGLTAERIEHLVTIAPSPGMTDATSIIYVATGCTQCARNAQGPEEQAMSIRHLPLADAVHMVTTGEIIDAKTVVALLLVERRIQEL